MSCRPVVRKSDVGAPPARLSAGAAPSLSVMSAKRNARNSFQSTPRQGSARKRRAEDNLDLEESDTEHSEEHESADEVKSDKVKKTRKKRRFRLTDSTAKSRRRAERKAQLAAERKEREEQRKQMGEPDEEKAPSASPVPVQKPPMIRTYSPMQLVCDNLLRKLHAKDPEEYFAFPVTQSIAPDYEQVISEPMDFSTMRSHIEKNEYEELSEFIRHVYLVINNALAYNRPSTIYYVAAQKLQLIATFYFSEQHLRYLYHALPFCKDIPLHSMGLKPKTRTRVVSKMERNYTITDDMTSSAILTSVDVSLKTRLCNKTQLGVLDKQQGAVCLNVLNVGGADKRVLTMGDIVGKLQEGTPGLLVPQQHKTSSQIPISFLAYGPFSSFAPQYDSTWATLCDRDSRLVLSCYGDRQGVSNAVSLRDMVQDTEGHLIGVVDDLLDTLTDGEHCRTLTALRDEHKMDTSDMESLLEQVESLDNIGIEVSFVHDVREVMGVAATACIQTDLNKTGAMINDLALLQKNRLSSVPPSTLNEPLLPTPLESSLAGKIHAQLHSHISRYATPSDVISPAVIHTAIGLNEEDLDLLNEFFTPATL